MPMTDDDVATERARWNAVYRTSRNFKTTVNDWLVAMLGDRPPGVALDLCTGQGRNALHLARLGWRVTGIDLAEEGLRLAAEAAAREQLEVELVHADLDHYELGTERYDLALMIYAGDEVHVAEHARDSLKRGGLFLLEFFSMDSPFAAQSG
ncbi:MAG TPA: class I SAM-dependent methyltransferase, partial [Kofleriaceae bacterium]